MDWMLRFMLGLPPRKKDIQSLKKVAPELFDNNLSSGELRQGFNRHFESLYRIRFERDFLEAAIRDWIKSAPNHDARSIEQMRVSEKSCELPNCPMNDNTKSHKAIRGSEKHTEAVEEQILNFTLVGGGTKEPSSIFFEVVRRVHNGLLGKTPKKIIITDPYIFLNVGESGAGGGFDNLIKYLEILVKDKHASFDLLVTPSPKKTKSDVPVAELEQRLNSSFPNLKFERYKTNFKIHDRFYIGSYSGGSIVGVFGPSLNGLSSSDVVLVGEIESQVGSLDKLKKWFDL